MTRHGKSAAAFVTLTLLASVHAAHPASAYPAKPVRLIVPFSAGGSADNLARTLQPALSSALGQAVVIDNRGGASSVIGTERAFEDGLNRSVSLRAFRTPRDRSSLTLGSSIRGRAARQNSRGRPKTNAADPLAL
jgi:predicted alpha/beta-fold hydrolase